MKLIKKFTVMILAGVLAFPFGIGNSISTTHSEAYKAPDTMKWWNDSKFGMFIHLGAYSYYGQGEWAMSEQSISKEKYQTTIAKNFNPSSFNADEIVKYAKEAGMKYIVITAKHHEGLSMWDTAVSGFTDTTGQSIFSLQKYTAFKSSNRDILKELKDACVKAGIRFGLYYSIIDWNHPSQSMGNNFTTMKSWEARSAYIADMKAQLKELVVRYSPDIMWFDGDWTNKKSKATLSKWWTKTDGQDLYNYMKSLKKSIIVNERVCRGFGLGDFECPEQSIPERGYLPKRLWETCQTMNGCWGYKKTSEKDYASKKQMISELVNTVSRGGNYLLNIGPKGDGSMTSGSKKILKGFKSWMSVNGVSIYKTKQSPFKKDSSWGTYTKKGKVIYVHVQKWPKKTGKLKIKAYKKKKISKIAYLQGGKKIKYKRSGNNITLKVSKKPKNKQCSVIAVTYK